MILEEISERIAEALKAKILVAFGHAVDRIVLQVPPRLSMGDLATPVAMELARQLKKSPREIAQTLVTGLELPPLVLSASVEGGGYLNFRIDRGSFTVAFLRDVLPRPKANGERVIVEHTNINPNKAAHIGHLRNAVLGDTLVRCLRWLGYTVETQNYIDDTGVQVADVVVGFEHLLNFDEKQVATAAASTDVPFDYFCWDLYARVGSIYENGSEALQWRRDTLHKIESREGASARIAALVSKAIVRRHVATMLRLNIVYDVLTKESDILALHFWDRAFELLKQSGAVIFEKEGKHAGCWVMRLSETAEFEGLEEPDKILVRSNGTVTYVGKDIAYQMWKFGLLDRTFNYVEFLRYPDGKILWETTHEEGSPAAPRFGGASRVYNVIDIRQAYLQKIVKEGLRLLGHEVEAGRSTHFSYEMVALTPVTARALGMLVSEEDSSRNFLEMSGRKGLGVKADDLLDALQEKAEEAIRTGRSSGTESDAGEDESSELARQIAVAALRYFMLKYGRNKVIAFDFSEALTFEGDSGPYLQYSTVRAENIFRKMKERGVDARLDSASIDHLTINGEMADDMWEIVRFCAETAGAIQRAVDSLELSILTHHALELAQKFNSFYHKFPIMNEQDPDERQRRAATADAFRQTMHMVLGLLGVPIPQRM